MAVTQLSGLQEVLMQALQKARKTSEKVLISSVKQIDDTDPLLFFSIGQALEYEHRMFWSDPSESIVFAGIGNAYSITTDSSNRFEEVEKEWKRVLNDHFIASQHNISGTGPIFLGGFSFDSLKSNEEMWANFPQGLLILPKYLLTKKGNETWLTLNVFVSPTDTIEMLEKIVEDRDNLLTLKGKHENFDTLQTLSIKEVEKDKWIQAVKESTNQIAKKKIEKVVLARELRVENSTNFEVETILFRLREEQAASYLFAFENKGTCFLGASPERLIKKEQDSFLSTCLAGSTARGKTLREDKALGEELLRDRKNLHEHGLVVEFIQKAMEEHCDHVIVPKKPELYKVRDIQHLYTPVVGKTTKDVSLLKMVENLHPTPALGGYPSKDAVRMIRDIEILDRGWYAAPLGWIDYEGNGEFAVAIRSGLIQGRLASLFAGCGIVADSDPIKEYEETNMKFRPMLSALGGSKNCKTKI